MLVGREYQARNDPSDGSRLSFSIAFAPELQASSGLSATAKAFDPIFSSAFGQV